MADLAIEAGVDVVKHQTHIVEDEMAKLIKMSSNILEKHL